MVKANKALALIIGVGLCIIPIHRLNFVVFPTIGLGLVFSASIIAIYLNRQRLKTYNLHVAIPAAVIVLSVVIQSLIGLTDIKGLVMILVLAVAYMGAKSLGDDIFKPMLYALVIGAVSCVVTYFLEPEDMKTGGIYSMNNYNIAAAGMLMAFVLSPRKYWYISAPLVLVGVTFAGAEEGLFALAIIGVVIAVQALLKRSIDRRLVFTTMGAVAVLVILIFAGVFSGKDGLLDMVSWKVEAVESSNAEVATGYRFENYKMALTTIKPLGHGYQQIAGYNTVHSVPLIILYQLGIPAALAWLYAMLYGMVKSRHKIAFVGLFALSLVDNIFWIPAAAYTWVLLGITDRRQQYGYERSGYGETTGSVG